MAYFMTGIAEVFKINDLNLDITLGKKHFTQDSILTLVLNSKSVGGFSKFNYKNKLGDGKFDVIIVKKPQIVTPVNVWRLFLMGVPSFMDNDNFMVFIHNRRFFTRKRAFFKAYPRNNPEEKHLRYR
jgi:diacylglycerol kinase family enzyme